MKSKAPTDADVSRERILLGRLALLSRQGNLLAVRDELARYFDSEMPLVGAPQHHAAVRDARRNEDSDPLYLPIAELNLNVRAVNALERGLGVNYVVDLDKWRWPEDLLAIANFGPRALAELEAALKEVGAWQALRRRKLMYRCDAVGGLRGNRDNHD